MATVKEEGPAFGHLKLFIMPQRIQKRRLDIIKTAAKKRQIKTLENFGPEVTHVVTEFETVAQVLRSLKMETVDSLGDCQLVSLVWLTDSFKAGKPVDVTDTYRLQQEEDHVCDVEDTDTTANSVVPVWACQRITPLEHHNKHLVDAIEVLQLYAELRDIDQDYSRALAFRRASAVLKSLTFPVTDVSQLRNIKDIGQHVKTVIQEILEDGQSSEVEEIKQGSWFNKMKLFTSVFGVGPSTAKKWIDRNWTSIEEAAKLDTSNDWRVRWGLAFHNDLMTRVGRPEADNFTAIVRDEAQKLLPGTTVELTGGFRRGKKTGHDVDLLISHPEEGAEIGLLPRLLKRLEKQGLVLCGNHEKNSFSPVVLTQDFKLSLRGQLDHFEKWLGICKFPKTFQSDQIPPEDLLVSNPPTVSEKNGSVEDEYMPKSKMRKIESVREKPSDISRSERDWIARRVDLIVTPHSQYYYALVGWTGSKHFNRDLRLYATKVLNMKLTSHGLYSMAKGTSFPASSEKEVFDIMKLPYSEPWQRNC